LTPPRLGHKIRPRHHDRLAVVSIRQSTTQQVATNRASADLQYQLRQRAVALGWADDRVLVIDDDQGISGSSVENRPGFQRLLAEVSLGHVGAVFGREVSRLSRSCKDWYQLLELCALFQVLIADADGVYDPTDPNDRMLLGLRGMMSEAELHVLKARMHQGKLNKARRGELFTCVPIGYVRSADGGIALDGETERVDVAIHWRGGPVTRHETRQGLRTYRSLSGLAELRQRILELRGDGRTGEAIAEVLNREGYRVARGDAFTGDRVRQLLARFGQTGVPPRVRGASDLPGADECWLPELAKRLGVKPIVVHRWRWSGWLHARQLRGENGRWIVWAAAAEVVRLRRLRAFEIEHHGRRTPPSKLTTRAKRASSSRPTTRSQNGGD
jgi:DNA invertase Pin-like site-specific DNA recombinase